MKKASIRILGDLWSKVRQQALGKSMDESVAFLTANYFEAADRLVFLGENVIPARPRDYLRRSELHLQVSSLYISRVLNVAEDQGSTVIMVHSHPFERKKPEYSVTDDLGEAQTSETISRCLVENPPIGSLLFGQQHAAARVWSGLSKERVSADVTVLYQRMLQRFVSSADRNRVARDLVDRQVRALGDRAQNDIESLTIGIVGLGGTGSSVAEQLVRMGGQDFVLVDPDSFEPSNWSRLYGTTLHTKGTQKRKVEIIASHLEAINPNIICKSIAKSVMRREVLHALSGCDVIFSCLDRHAPRAVLNELSYQCYVPVVDVGVGLSKDRGGGLGGSIRATIIGPNLPCLLCQDIVRPEMITAEHLSPQEYAARRAEDYVGELVDNAPSVISYTTMASSLGLILFLDFITGGNPNFVSNLLFDLNSKETIRLRTKIRSDCACQKRLGKGFRLPFS